MQVSNIFFNTKFHHRVYLAGRVRALGHQMVRGYHPTQQRKHVQRLVVDQAQGDVFTLSLEYDRANGVDPVTDHGVQLPVYIFPWSSNPCVEY